MTDFIDSCDEHLRTVISGAEHAGIDREIFRARLHLTDSRSHGTPRLQSPAASYVCCARLPHSQAAGELQRVLVSLHLRSNDRFPLGGLSADLLYDFLCLPQDGTSVHLSCSQRIHHARLSVCPQTVRCQVC